MWISGNSGIFILSFDTSLDHSHRIDASGSPEIQFLTLFSTEMRILVNRTEKIERHGRKYMSRSLGVRRVLNPSNRLQHAHSRRERVPNYLQVPKRYSATAPPSILEAGDGFSEGEINLNPISTHDKPQIDLNEHRAAELINVFDRRRVKITAYFQ